MSAVPPPPGERPDSPKSIAAAISEVSERATLLVREEIELAKTEVTEKVGKLAKGAVVAVAAGIFLVTALFFVLIGLPSCSTTTSRATSSRSSGASSRWP